MGLGGREQEHGVAMTVVEHTHTHSHTHTHALPHSLTRLRHHCDKEARERERGERERSAGAVMMKRRTFDFPRDLGAETHLGFTVDVFVGLCRSLSLWRSGQRLEIRSSAHAVAARLRTYVSE